MRPVLPPALPFRAAPSSVTTLSLPTRVYSDKGGFHVLYLLLILAIATLVYIGLRAARAHAQRPTTRVIGPDDDPEFLWKLGGGDKNS